MYVCCRVVIAETESEIESKCEHVAEALYIYIDTHTMSLWNQTIVFVGRLFVDFVFKCHSLD